jgi:cytochrome c oxidase cbb3-type subunit 4
MLARFAQTGGLVIFIVGFALVLLYALSPKRTGEFAKAARAPLDEDPIRDESSLP